MALVFHSTLKRNLYELDSRLLPPTYSCPLSVPSLRWVPSRSISRAWHSGIWQKGHERTTLPLSQLNHDPPRVSNPMVRKILTIEIFPIYSPPNHCVLSSRFFSVHFAASSSPALLLHLLLLSLFVRSSIPV